MTPVVGDCPPATPVIVKHNSTRFLRSNDNIGFNYKFSLILILDLAARVVVSYPR